MLKCASLLLLNLLFNSFLTCQQAIDEPRKNSLLNMGAIQMYNDLFTRPQVYTKFDDFSFFITSQGYINKQLKSALPLPLTLNTDVLKGLKKNILARLLKKHPQKHALLGHYCYPLIPTLMITYQETDAPYFLYNFSFPKPNRIDLLSGAISIERSSTEDSSMLVFSPIIESHINTLNE